MKVIDLRSDTVTKPTAKMREKMANAEVGDDVYGEDPTVNHLESLSAQMFGKDAAIFVSSGTQSNLLALLTHCQRGDEYIVGQDAHTYMFEGGGAAVLGSIQPQPLEFEKDGTLDLDKVSKAIKPDDFHFARTCLLCLENTLSGLVLPLEYLASVKSFANKYKLKTHLDGARIFNAAVKLNVPVENISRHFDTVSFCLSKGLGAPVGSLLCGNKEQIKQARRWRKVLGGGMRQSGILAAAGIFALENNVDRLAEDHANATLLAKSLSEIEGLKVNSITANTNMVFVPMAKNSVKLSEFLKQRNIIVSEGDPIRLVTHLDVKKEDITTVVTAFKEFFLKEQ